MTVTHSLYVGRNEQPIPANPAAYEARERAERERADARRLLDLKDAQLQTLRRELAAVRGQTT